MLPDKCDILAHMIDQLQADLLVLEQAVALARDTATHADCLGSSKYETMGLEASYLAQGQGMRLLQVERSLAYFKTIRLTESAKRVVLSSLLQIEDEYGEQMLLWLAAEAGGLKVQCGEHLITVITPKAPLGAALMGRVAQDDFEISIAGVKRSYEITAIF